MTNPTFVLLPIVIEYLNLWLFYVVGNATELIVVMGAAVGVALMLCDLPTQHARKVTFRRNPATAPAGQNSCRSNIRFHLAALKAEAVIHFQRWRLNPSERKVGLLLLLGMNHAGIAALLGTPEVKVRRQIRSVLRKAGLPDSDALVAFFFDDFPEIRG